MTTTKRPTKPTEGALKVWWLCQLGAPIPTFEVSVATIAEGRKLLDVLGDYDLFQLEHRIKPDYSNAGGLSRFEDGEWCNVDDDEEDGDRERYQNALKRAGWGGIA